MRRPVVSQAESLSIPTYEHSFPSPSCRCRRHSLLADKSADWFAVAFAVDREAFCCIDPTPRPAISRRVCRMKPQLQPRSIHVLRHAHHILRRAGLFPSLFSHGESCSQGAPHTTTRRHLQHNRSFAPRHRLAIPLVSTQRQSNPIGRGFLQVAVSKAPARSDEIQDSS